MMVNTKGGDYTWHSVGQIILPEKRRRRNDASNCGKKKLLLEQNYNVFEVKWQIKRIFGLNEVRKVTRRIKITKNN